MRVWNARVAAGVLVFCTGVWTGGCRKSDDAFDVINPPVPQRLRVYWQVPPFSLTERSGRVVGLGDLEGKVWVADFFYTTCPGPCPMLTSRLSELHRAAKLLPNVAFVSISADPEKDTPEVLGKYAEKFGADERWLFLTGTKDAVYGLANLGFKLGLSEDLANEREPVTHSTKLVLVDRNANVRGFYEGLTPEGASLLLSDMELLLKESR